MNAQRIQSAIAALRGYRETYRSGDVCRRDDEGHLVIAGVPAILADRLDIHEWHEIDDGWSADGLHRLRWIDHYLGRWLGVDDVTATALEEAETIHDAIDLLGELIDPEVEDDMREAV